MREVCLYSPVPKQFPGSCGLHQNSGRVSLVLNPRRPEAFSCGIGEGNEPP